MKIALYLSFFFIATAFAQVALKIVASGPGGQDYLLLFSDPLFYVCCVGFIAQAYTWIAVLKVMPLSQAYPISSLNVVFTLVCAAVFFNEAVTLENVIGSVIIVAGIIILSCGRRDERESS